MIRQTHLKYLKSSSVDPEQAFDILIVGGGATGIGTALTASLAGYKVALLEKDDFCSKTSSKSTKLIHGGVRYLELAVKNLDISQFVLVYDALKERDRLFRLAPHVVWPLRIVLPTDSAMHSFYYSVGLNLYDLIAYSELFPKTKKLSKETLTNYFPFLKKSDFHGGVEYSDGQFNDTRLGMSAIKTAIDHGAHVCNYIEVKNIQKLPKYFEVEAHDQISKENFKIRAKVIVNAAGPACDHIRQILDPSIKPILKVSSGTHIVTKKIINSDQHGLIIPKTKDGRVIFVLPWLDYTLIGTTDDPTEWRDNPKANAKDIAYLLEHLKKYLDLDIAKEEILAAWCGLRPLVQSTSHLKGKKSTASLVRDHLIFQDDSGLVTVTGGKWTTFLKMGDDTVKFICKKKLLFKRKKKLKSLQKFSDSISWEDFLKNASEKISIKNCHPYFLKRLFSTYGKEGLHFLKGHTNDPWLPSEEEVRYLCRQEFAQTPMDILVRRLRIGMLHSSQALKYIEPIAQTMKKELGWTKEEHEEHIRTASIETRNNYSK